MIDRNLHNTSVWKLQKLILTVLTKIRENNDYTKEVTKS